MLQHPRTGQVLFTHRELATRDTGVVRLATGFADLLVELRVAFGRPMRITSCCRTIERNKRENGHYRSLHLVDNPGHEIDGTAAIDVQVGGAAPGRWELVKIAQELGWSFGQKASFTHLDRRDLAGLQPGAFGY